MGLFGAEVIFMIKKTGKTPEFIETVFVISKNKIMQFGKAHASPITG
jgi:hypothetical protein